MANFFDSVFTPWDSKQGFTVFSCIFDPHILPNLFAYFENSVV